MTDPDYSTPDPGEPRALEEDFERLTEILARLGEDTMHRLDQADDDLAALELLYDLRAARKELHQLEAAVEAEAARRMAAPKVEWPGFLAERKGGAIKKNWRHNELAWRVLEPLAVDRNGVIDYDAADLLNLARARLLGCIGYIGSWRSTSLQELGIDPKEFCTFERGRRSVIVNRVAE